MNNTQIHTTCGMYDTIEKIKTINRLMFTQCYQMSYELLEYDSV
jgi:hypothetical protein